MARLKDIAREAGVSISAVSLALRDHHSIGEETKRRIRKIQQKLGYTRHLTPRKADSVPSARKRNLQIDFVLIDASFNARDYAIYFQSIVDAARSDRIRFSYLSLNSKDLQKGVFPSPLKNRKMDGMIVSGKYDQVSHRKLSSLGIPFVVMGNYDRGTENWHSCEIGYEIGMYRLISHLHDLGHRKLALVHSVLGLRCDWEIEWAYHRATTLLKMEGMILAKTTTPLRVEAISRLLDTPDRPTAMILSTPSLSIEVYGLCEKKGLTIPDDLSVATMGEDIVSHHPPIASVYGDPAKIGRASLEKLLALIEDPHRPPIREIVEETLFHPRGSLARAKPCVKPVKTKSKQKP